MSGFKRFAFTFNLFIGASALFLGACTQPVVVEEEDDTVHLEEVTLDGDGDGVRTGGSQGAANTVGGTTIKRGELNQGPHPEPWNEGPHPEPWAGGASSGGQDTGSSGTSGGTGGSTTSSSGSTSSGSGTGTKNGS